MNNPILRITRILRAVLAGAGLIALSMHSAFPQSPTGPSDTQSKEHWRKTMSQKKLPTKGCFKAAYPATTWSAVPCGAPSPHPNRPARGLHPDAVGDGTGYEGEVSGLISSATGEFKTVSPSTVTETGQWVTNSAQANAFTLQLNTQFFTTPVCDGVPGCQGWQQFLFSQNQCGGPCVYMEYWLLNYGSPCPPGRWQSIGASDCWYNSVSTAASALTAGELQGTTLTGQSAGGTDTVILSTTSGDITAMAVDSVLDLEQAWTTSEFNVFGDGDYAEANFSAGTTIVVDTTYLDGISSAPTCVSGGTSGETNNLTLIGTSAISGQAFPTVEFTESNATSTTPVCATASGYAAPLNAIIDSLL